MPTFQGTEIEFELPDWKHFLERSRLVFQGPGGEELIISGGSVIGNHVPAVADAVFRNAIQAARNAAAHPDLVITEDFGQDPTVVQTEIWTLRSETRDGTAFSLKRSFVVNGAQRLSLSKPRTLRLRRRFSISFFDRFVHGRPE